jgi:photosystem II stability/assembly factor-like uncharacterized protein
MLLENFASIFENSFLSRAATVVISGITILSAATGCNVALPGLSGLQGDSNQVLGVLKREPSRKLEGFVRANAVKTGNEQNPVNVQGLSNLSSIKMLRYDKDNLILLTQEKGMFVSSEAGRVWERRYIFPVSSNKTNEQERNNELNDKITRNDAFEGRDIAVNPRDKNNFFIAGKDKDNIGKIFQTVDGGQTFTQIYSEVQADIGVNLITIDPVNPLRLYAALERGAIVRSLDGGRNWQKIQGFGSAPVQLFLTPALGGQLYALVGTEGLYVSKNEGDKWEKIEVKKYSPPSQNTEDNNFLYNDSEIRDFTKITPVIPASSSAANPASNITWIMVAGKKLWRTNDFGRGFDEIKLPVQSDQVEITDFAIDPKEGDKRMLVSVDNKLLETNNGGVDWSTTDKIVLDETIGVINSIVIDNENPEIVYLLLASEKTRTNRRFIF